MTRLVTRGFESGIIADETDSYSGPTLQTTTKRTGEYALQVPQNTWAQWNFPDTDQVYVGFAWRTPSIAGSTNFDLFRIASPDSNISLRPQPDGAIDLFRNAVLISESAVSLYLANVWHYIEVWVWMHDSTGRVVVKVDSDTVIDFTGDTLGAVNANMTNLRIFGIQYYTTFFDDLVINDDAGSVNNTWPGVIYLEPLFPSGAGDATMLTPTAGSNWECVDEQPANGTDYVYSTSINNYDLYEIENFACPENAVIRNVIVQARSGVDTGTGNIEVMVKSGGVEDQSAEFTLPVGWRLANFAWDANPYDDEAWEDADIDALQIGVKVT